MTRRLTAEQQLRRQVSELQAELAVERAFARTDALTQLPNRRAFDEALAHERADKLTILLVDANGFKRVNDTKGHAAGDRLLCQIADALRLLVRTGDLVARLGGDEFAILLRRADEAVAARVAAEIRTVVLDELTLSVGFAQGSSALDVLAEADRRMYQGKRAS